MTCQETTLYLLNSNCLKFPQARKETDNIQNTIRNDLFTPCNRSNERPTLPGDASEHLPLGGGVGVPF